MGQKTITLSTREDLKVYMSPLRQELLRIMEIHGRPMTAKALADRLKISASSAQHHIKKLMGLGIIVPDHTELKNGITASFFRLAGVTVSIGQMMDDLVNERKAVVQSIVHRKMEAYFKGLETAKAMGIPADTLRQYGDMQSGVVHLNPSDAQELFRMITEFTESHSRPSEDTQAYEYALIAYNAGALENESLE